MNGQTDFNKLLRKMANDLQTLTICLTLAQADYEDKNIKEAAAAAGRLVQTYKQLKHVSESTKLRVTL